MVVGKAVLWGKGKEVSAKAQVKEKELNEQLG